MKLPFLTALISAAILLSTSPARAQVGREKGEAFLAENAKKEGVKVLPSGLQYRVLKEGTGKQPTKADKVVVHYRGTLIDGREFDSSYKRGEPSEFGVTQVIKGWTEALQLMKEGSKWMVYIPWELAYGAQARGGLIGPNETLVFEVELISIR
ncbi:MAG: FKBP-type peptidyl-prolyl cis-trans isomerase [Chthoniobacteraceae bacterium]